MILTTKMINKMIVCPYCGKLKEHTEVLLKRTTFSVKTNSYYTIDYTESICLDCGLGHLDGSHIDEFVTNLEKVSQNTEGFLIGEQVYKLVDNYNITAEELSLILDWDVKRIGEMSLSLKKIVNTLISDPELFDFILNLRKDKLNLESYEKIKRRMKAILSGKLDIYDDEFEY